MPTIQTLALSLYKCLPSVVLKDFTAMIDIHQFFFFLSQSFTVITGCYYGNHNYLRIPN